MRKTVVTHNVMQNERLAFHATLGSEHPTTWQRSSSWRCEAELEGSPLEARNTERTHSRIHERSRVANQTVGDCLLTKKGRMRLNSSAHFGNVADFCCSFQ